MTDISKNSKNTKPLVGIIGGMGMAATANFLRLFTKEMNKRGAVEDADFPPIVMRTIPLEEWDYCGARDKARVREQLLGTIIEMLACDVIAVPCNSVHEFADDWPDSVINIIVHTLMATSDTRVGVLCSRQTRDSGLYEREGFETLYVDDQTEVDQAIQRVLRGDRPWINNLAWQLRNKGARNIILGCTELSLCEIGGPDVIDSTVCLASALADYVCNWQNANSET